MLDHLKKARHGGVGAQERLRLSLYVAGLLILGGVIVVGSMAGRGTPEQPGGGGEPAASAAPPAPPLDPGEVRRLVAASQDEPERFSAPAIEYVRTMRREGRLLPVEGRLEPGALAALPPEEARGRHVEVEGRLIERAREEYRPQPDASGNDRLWTLVLEGADGARTVVLKVGHVSEPDEGAPVDAKPPNVRGDALEVGQYVVARGVVIQRRTGTLGRTALLEPTPVLLGFAFRIGLEPAQRSPPIPSLDEALWSEVRDRFNRESRRWDEDTLFEVLQWARARGYAACREDVLRGDLGWTEWNKDVFETWKQEVAVDAEDPRPFTEAARGRVWRISGIVGEVLEFGWERVPPNPWSIDSFQSLTLISDHYRNVALRLFLPYPITEFDQITGERAEHLRVYGVFVKNFTYDTKFQSEDGSDRPIQVTVPLFVVLHAEPFPEDAASRRMHTLMLWVAGAMVLFGLVFYLVLVRGGQRQVRRMEEHRWALRKRARAAGQGPEARPAAPAEPEPPAED